MKTNGIDLSSIIHYKKQKKTDNKKEPARDDKILTTQFL